MGMVEIRRFDILLVALDPTLGVEIQQTRPCLVISPDEMNRYIQTIIVAPMTSNIKGYPTRICTVFKNKKGEIVLDQIRTIDKLRILKKLGALNKKDTTLVLETLRKMFQ